MKRLICKSCTFQFWARLGVARGGQIKECRYSRHEGGAEGGEEWCDHSRNSDRCVNVSEGRQARDETPLLSLYLWRWRWWGEKRRRAQTRWRDAARSGSMTKSGLSAYRWKRWRASTDTASAVSSCSTVSSCVILCVRCGGVFDRSRWVSAGMEIMTVTSMKHWTGTSSNDHISSLTFCRYNL